MNNNIKFNYCHHCVLLFDVGVIAKKATKSEKEMLFAVTLPTNSNIKCIGRINLNVKFI